MAERGAGLGAMHQTGWTALVVDLILAPPAAAPAAGVPRRTHPGSLEPTT